MPVYNYNYSVNVLHSAISLITSLLIIPVDVIKVVCTKVMAYDKTRSWQAGAHGGFLFVRRGVY